MKKLLGVSGGLVTGVGAAGAFGTCHALCTAAIAGLAAVGITITGMPLMFLQNPLFYVPFSLLGIGLLVTSVVVWKRQRACCSQQKVYKKQANSSRKSGSHGRRKQTEY